MFQADALFPWKTVLGNVMVGPTLNGMSKKEAVALARDWLRRVGLAGFEDRYPHQLSGGMRKRVAMAAALINEPQILLMDEPFGALDVQTKAIMQTELLGLWEQLRPSVLFITHDLDEAVALADRVLIMTQRPGVDQGELRHRPAAPARRGAGDPPRAALPRAAGPDLGLAQGRGRARLRADGRCGMTPSTATPPIDRARRVDRRSTSSARPVARARRRRRCWSGWAGILAAGHRHRRLAVVHRPRAGRQVLLRPAVGHLAQPGAPVHQGHRVRLDLAEPVGHDQGGALRLPARHRRRDRRRTAARPEPFPRRRARPVHQDRQRDPAHHPRLDLHRRVRPRHVPEGAARRRPRVLHRLLQRLPRRARGRPEPRRERARCSAPRRCRSPATSRSRPR